MHRYTHELLPRKRSSPSLGVASVVPSAHVFANLNLPPSIPMSPHHHQQQQQHEGSTQLPRSDGSSTMRTSGTGEIVEVQGGHIVRSIGRKDRHSKVCTSKGPRDRRVRLSAHTAIQFYDVQDRLGYDRPSKAVDWLIENAKAAIDKLDQLPPWQPTATTVNSTTLTTTTTVNHVIASSKNVVEPVSQPAPPTAPYNYAGSDLLPPSLESDAIADTIKFFFPATATAAVSTSCYSPKLPSVTRAQTQDLRLSLQSLHDPVLIQSHSSTSTPLALEQNPRVAPWNLGGGSGSVEIFNLAVAQQQQPAAQPSHAMPLHQVCSSTVVTQRGPLQSNSLQPFRAWTDPMAAMQHVELSEFASGGFRIPAIFHCDGEHAAGAPGKPPSSPSPTGSHRRFNS